MSRERSKLYQMEATILTSATFSSVILFMLNQMTCSITPPTINPALQPLCGRWLFVDMDVCLQGEAISKGFATSGAQVTGDFLVFCPDVIFEFLGTATSCVTKGTHHITFPDSTEVAGHLSLLVLCAGIYT